MRPILCALLVLLHSPLLAQERPPIALPAPSQAPNVSATNTVEMDALALAAAIEGNGCTMTPATTERITQAAGLTSLSMIRARVLLEETRVLVRQSGGYTLTSCGTQPTPQEPAPPPEPEPEVEEKPPLTLLQKRRCDDRPNLSFCD